MSKKAQKPGAKPCSKCGKARCERGSRFCGWCGNAIRRAMHSTGYLTPTPGGSNDRN